MKQVIPFLGWLTNYAQQIYRKCPNQRLERLFNFLRREGGRLFPLQVFLLQNFTSLFLVNCNIKIQKILQKITFCKLETFSRHFLVNKVKHLYAHMVISIEEMRSKPVRLKNKFCAIMKEGGALIPILSLRRGTNLKRGAYLKLGAYSSIYPNRAVFNLLSVVKL